MSVFQFIIASLACYRVTVLIARDLGPFDIFKRLRSMNGIGNLLSCPMCVSIWVAVAIEAAFLFCGVWDSPVVIACLVLAMSGITVALDRVFTIDFQP